MGLILLDSTNSFRSVIDLSHCSYVLCLIQLVMKKCLVKNHTGDLECSLGDDHRGPTLLSTACSSS